MITTADIKNLTVTDLDTTYFFLTEKEVASDTDAFNGYDPDDCTGCECCNSNDDLYLVVDESGCGDGELSCTWWCKQCILESANGIKGSFPNNAALTWKVDVND